MGAHSNRADLNGSGPFYVDLDIVSGTQNIPGNYTDFAWGLYIGCADNGWGTFSGSPQNWSVNIAGVTGSGTFTLDFTPSGTSGRRYLIASNPALAVAHNGDGTRPGFPNYGSIDTNHSSVGDGTVTTWADAPTIPRASTASWNIQGTPKYINSSNQLDLNRADASFTHDLTYTFGAASGTIGTGVGNTVNWTPPSSLLTQIPNSPTGTGTITTVTKQGATVIGTTTSGFELTAALTVVPDFTTVTNSEAVAGVAANIGGYVQSISKLALAITGATGVSGSTITSYKIEVSGQTINAISGTTPSVISTSGTVVITGTITDSRGRQKVKTVNITVLAYVPPAIAALSIQRSQSGGTPDENGTYMRVNLNAAVASLIVSTQRNALVYRISTRLRGTPTWTLKANTTPGGITFNSFVTVGTYSITDAYDVLVEVVDDFSTTAIQLLVGVASIYVHFKGDEGIGFGKFNERGRQDVFGDIYFQRAVDYSDWRALTNIGTTAQRDAIYALPASDANRVALANRLVTWFNTDLGWQESYYAVTGLSGLTVPGLVSGTASGWYPTGSGPFISLVASAPQSIAPSTVFTNWTAPGTGNSRRRGGTAWFTIASGVLTAVIAGDYKLGVHMMHQGGAGTHEYAVYRDSTEYVGSYARNLLSGAWTRSEINQEHLLMAAGQNLRLKGVAGTADMGMGGNNTLIGNEFALTYQGPSLVSN